MAKRFVGFVVLSSAFALAIANCAPPGSGGGDDHGFGGEGDDDDDDDDDGGTGGTGAATTGGKGGSAGSGTAGKETGGSAGTATAGSSNGGSPDQPGGAGGVDAGGGTDASGEGGMPGGGGEGGAATDLCAGNTCSDHGDCDDASGAAVCECDAGYVGAACDDCDTGYQDNDENGSCQASCDGATCSGHGECSDSSGTATCACGAGYDGASCSECDPGYAPGGEGTCVLAPDTVAIRWSDSSTLAAGDVAGYVPVKNWNNALGKGPGQGDNGAKSELVNGGGFVTVVSVIWDSQDVELTTITGGGAGDQKLMGEGIRSWQGQGNASLTFSGLDSAFPDGYRMVIHVGRGGGYPTNHSANFTLTAGTDAAITGKVMPVFDGTWDLLTGGTDAGNYFVSSTQSAATATVSIAATGGATLPTAAINGIEFIPATKASRTAPATKR